MERVGRLDDGDEGPVGIKERAADHSTGAEPRLRIHILVKPLVDIGILYVHHFAMLGTVADQTPAVGHMEGLEAASGREHRQLPLLLVRQEKADSKKLRLAAFPLLQAAWIKIVKESY